MSDKPGIIQQRVAGNGGVLERVPRTLMELVRPCRKNWAGPKHHKHHCAPDGGEGLVAYDEGLRSRLYRPCFSRDEVAKAETEDSKVYGGLSLLVASWRDRKACPGRNRGARRVLQERRRRGNDRLDSCRPARLSSPYGRCAWPQGIKYRQGTVLAVGGGGGAAADTRHGVQRPSKRGKRAAGAAFPVERFILRR